MLEQEPAPPQVAPSQSASLEGVRPGARRAPATSSQISLAGTGSPPDDRLGQLLARCVAQRGGRISKATLQRTPADDIAALKAEQARLEAIVKPGSGKSLGEVGAAYAKLADVMHDLSILEKRTGTRVGSKVAAKDRPKGAVVSDCTTIVMEVLAQAFAQQNLGAVWSKVTTKLAQNQKIRETAGAKPGMSGLDLQAALQSEAGWKGVFWAPDPAYQVPEAELAGAKPDEARYTSRQGTYYKGGARGKTYPGVSVDQRVTNYAPEVPRLGVASTTKKDMAQLEKLKRLPFGVLSAHGALHMTLITSGKVLEVHWDRQATDPNLIEQTDLESWAVGPNSGYHYYASGVLVAPAADVDAAFK